MTFPDDIDPITLASVLWPSVELYDRQRAIVDSVWDNDETVVPAAHMVGKDFISGIICLLFFLTRHPCRIVTTSVDGAQLEGVLWGEIRKFIQMSAIPLEAERGGPLLINHMHIRKVVNGQVDGLSYLIGRVAAKGEGMSGHHIARTGDGIPRTLFLADEASGLDEVTCEKATEWANRMLLIGNPYQCSNRFRWGVKGKPGTDDRGGDIPRPGGNGYLRKIIKIRGEDSPNVQYALAQQRKGRTPTGKLILPGVLPWEDYQKRRLTWDKAKIAIGIDAEFYEGAEILLYPPDWLSRAERLADLLKGKPRQAKAIGIDPGEGSADTAMAAVDELGLIELVYKKTPDTSVVTGEAIAFMHKHNVDPRNVAFDAGGGGVWCADRLRQQGYPVRTVAFGEAASPQLRRGMARLDERIEAKEDRYVYKNRRAEMYGELSILLDPTNEAGFAIPSVYTELRRQLAPIPKLYDPEGRLYLPAKNKRDKNSKEVTLSELIGCSPDLADALVLAVHVMLHKAYRPKAGAAQ